jgi:hypothetical protein
MIYQPLWIDLIIMLAATLIPFGTFALWIWGLVCAIMGKQDVFAIIYYVVTAVIFSPFLFSMLSYIPALFHKKPRSRQSRKFKPANHDSDVPVEVENSFDSNYQQIKLNKSNHSWEVEEGDDMPFIHDNDTTINDKTPRVTPKKKLSGVITLWVMVVLLAALSGYLMWSLHSITESSSTLLTEYNKLNSTYQILQGDYADYKDENEKLVAKVDELNGSLSELTDDYLDQKSLLEYLYFEKSYYWELGYSDGFNNLDSQMLGAEYEEGHISGRYDKIRSINDINYVKTNPYEGNTHRPKNGDSFVFPDYFGDAELIINNKTALDMCVFIEYLGSTVKSTIDRSPIPEVEISDANIYFYLRSGESVSEMMPVGTYKLYYACGETWHNPVDHFGSRTTYYALDDNILFYVNDDYPNGNQTAISLKYDQNLQIDYDKFPSDFFYSN